MEEIVVDWIGLPVKLPALKYTPKNDFLACFKVGLL